MFPIGSIYTSINSTSPSILFGGTWEQIQGRFLLSADSSYVAGSTGGAATVNLSSNNIPSHNHSINITTTSNGSHTHNLKSITYDGQTVHFFNADSSGGSWVGDTQFMLAAKRNLGNVSGVNHVLTVNNLMTGNPINSGGSHNHTVSGVTGNYGSSAAHDNMPPYLTVYMWKRTA